ncbi:MAG: hypothetical protein H0W64_04995 [Gammaproteobacteria bacterium]|nr:hypothetical protein [Gammaproteobacteria bacterium]
MNTQKQQRSLQLPSWIVVWLILSMMIILWDSGFLFSRPASLPGGSLAWVWLPYAKYITIDPSYTDLHNDFLVAQQIMSLLEIAIGIIALYYNYRCKGNRAILFAFSALLLTGTKTILVFLLEAVSGFKNIGHNSGYDLLLFYIMPNSLWLIFPFAGVFILGRYLISSR